MRPASLAALVHLAMVGSASGRRYLAFGYLRQGQGGRQFYKLHPFHIPAEVPESLQPVARALELLQSLSRRRNYRPVAETINVLLSATLAREYESSGGTSFRGFVEQLLADAERGKQAEAAIDEDGADGVRLMSVHKAKGLEFPVVILADVTAKIARYDPDL